MRTDRACPRMAGADPDGSGMSAWCLREGHGTRPHCDGFEGETGPLYHPPRDRPAERARAPGTVSAVLRRTVERLRPAGRAASAEQTPVVIFGSGGSGTRTLQLLADRAGYFMGANLNAPGDSLDIGRFMQRWLNRYLTKSNWIDQMCEGSGSGKLESPSAMADEFHSAIESHRAGIEDAAAPWGWKAPRTILMLPFVHEMYPAMKAVHLVRDGRDMAFSRNQNQVRAQGAKVLSKADLELGRPIRSIKFWARVNLAAARYGSAGCMVIW